MKVCAAVLCVVALAAISWIRARRAGLAVAQDASLIVAALVASGAIVLLARPGWTRVPAIALAVVAGAGDARYGYVFDEVVSVGACAVLAVAALGGAAGPALLGALIGGLPLLVLVLISRGRALGLGDVKLAAAISLGLGGFGALEMLTWAFALGGSAAAIGLWTGRRRRGDSVPFGPWLALGAVLVAGGVPV